MVLKDFSRKLRFQLALGLIGCVVSASAAAADDIAPILSASDYFAGTSQGVEEPANQPEAIAEELEIDLVGFESDPVPMAQPVAAYEYASSPVVCRPAVKCATPWWAHRSGAFGEFLFLRPGSTDLIYAVEQTDPNPANASPTGPVGIANIDGEAGFRTGFALAASECSSLLVTFAWWDGETTSNITANAPNVLDSRIIHPSVATSGAASLAARSTQGINFQTMDLAYRHLWKATDTMALNWSTGLRYGNLEQTSSSDQTVQVVTGLTNVRTDIDFDGFGITGGLDFERYSCASGLSVYGKSMLSLLAGDWEANYRQTNQFGGGVIANSIEDFRITPVVDAELGLRWTGLDGHVRVHTGLMASAWYDAMTTRSYVSGVRTGQFQEIEETLTFMGLTSGLELRF